MYRTARAAIYDVVDTVFISVVVTEYTDTPGLVEPRVSHYSASTPSHGYDDQRTWLMSALVALVDELK